MKYVLPALAAFLLPLSPAFSGNWFGPGPWANGAYYPGQYDGVYSATMFNGNPSVISGVLGFGLQNGAPTTATNSTVSDTGVQNSITVDPFQNYFVAFVNGRTYAGLTVANIDNQSDQVSGGLYNGEAAPTISVIATTNFPGTTNQTVTLTEVSSANTAGGGFVASLTGKKDVITFSGNNSGTLQESSNGSPVGTASTFSLNGMKVGNQISTGTQ
jgi:hypothetical protein